MIETQEHCQCLVSMDKTGARHCLTSNGGLLYSQFVFPDKLSKLCNTSLQDFQVMPGVGVPLFLIFAIRHIKFRAAQSITKTDNRRWEIIKIVDQNQT